MNKQELIGAVADTAGLSKGDASKAVEDAALLTWTVNVDPPSDGVNTLLNCPSSTSPVQ